MYTNEKIKKLIEDRNKQISYFDHEIEKEIEKERARYKFSWKNFCIVLAITIVPFMMYKINIKIFPKDSIWSWDYYIK